MDDKQSLMGRGQVTWTIKILESTNHISGTAEPSVVKFCVQVGYVKSQLKDDKSPLKWRDQSHVTHFKFWANDISGMAEARIVKIVTLVDCLKSHSIRMTSPL